MNDAYLHEVKDVLETLRVDPQTGLSESEARKRRNQYGKNSLPPAPTTSFWRLVLSQFDDLLVKILLAAAFVSFILGFLDNDESVGSALVEPSVILIILIINAIIGVVQESNAEQALEKLKEYAAREATVVRDGKAASIDPIQLVPGDIVKISVGQKVPADLRLISLTTATLSVDESMLTGEAESVMKELPPIENAGHIVDQDKTNMLFSGTLAVRGRGVGVVCLTGIRTSIGCIQHDLMDQEPERTPLQQVLDVLAVQLSKIILGICILVWLINIGHFRDPEYGGVLQGAMYYFKIAVALAVAAIPEGLPAVVTTCLALGTMKMAKRNAIVRSLPSVETLGCTTVICSDKTGTLTTNKMTVQNVMVIDHIDEHKYDSDAHAAVFVRTYSVGGDGFSPIGQITDLNENMPIPFPASHRALATVGKISALCNESHLVFKHKGEEVLPTDINSSADASNTTASKGRHSNQMVELVSRVKVTGNGGHNTETDLDQDNEIGHSYEYGMTGEPTEAALSALAEKICVPDYDRTEGCRRSMEPRVRLDFAKRYWEDRYQREFLLEFSRDRKSMSVVCKDANGRRFMFVKGAPESILKRCTTVETNDGKLMPLNHRVKSVIEHSVESFASGGLRVLALASIADPPDGMDFTDLDKYEEIETYMTFAGLAGMLDPPRAEVAGAIRLCTTAGIRVIVITGDNKKTAEAICRRIGIFGEDEDLRYKSFIGAEFMQLSEAEQQESVKVASLFSRVEPNHKMRLVKLLKDQGEVVAMTGDGVNDAPALKKADIGVAMGSGTAVAREASDMVLQDDNFSTIVMAVEQGRAIYANTKAFIRYLISSNIGEVICIFLTALLGIPDILIPVQLLWVNLVTDGPPATALGFNKPDNDVMQQPPRGRNSKIIDGWMFFRYVAVGVYIGVATVLAYIWWHLYYSGGYQISYKQLVNFHSCGPENELFQNIDCDIFHDRRPSTVGLSVLVTIEMFNTFNALSENQSLFVIPPWSNVWVGVAVFASIGLHCFILYIPFLTEIFSTASLNFEEWFAVVLISFPVILLDELLKVWSRRYTVTQFRPKKIKKHR